MAGGLPAILAEVRLSCRKNVKSKVCSAPDIKLLKPVKKVKGKGYFRGVKQPSVLHCRILLGVGRAVSSGIVCGSC